MAGVLPDAERSTPDSTSVSAMRALLTRCLPAVLDGSPARTTGMLPAAAPISQGLLGARTGTVWTDRRADLLMVHFADVPTCRVIGLGIDPAVMADLVIRLFSEAETPFRRERFRLDADGGFAAVYAIRQGGEDIVIRMSTAQSVEGSRFANLTVERSPAAPVRMR